MRGEGGEEGLETYPVATTACTFCWLSLKVEMLLTS